MRKTTKKLKQHIVIAVNNNDFAQTLYKLKATSMIQPSLHLKIGIMLLSRYIFQDNSQLVTRVKDMHITDGYLLYLVKDKHITDIYLLCL